MPTWTPTEAQKCLLDRLRGSLLFTPVFHPERAGWMLLLGRGSLAGVVVDMPVRLLAAFHWDCRMDLCRELLEAQKERAEADAVHLVNIPQGVTDCGKDAEGLRVTLSRPEATCPGCLPEKAAPQPQANRKAGELYVSVTCDTSEADGALESLEARADRIAGKLEEIQRVASGPFFHGLLVSVDPAPSGDHGVVGHVEQPTERKALEGGPCGDGQVDAFLVGLADIARATRDLAEAEKLGNCGGYVTLLIEDVVTQLRARVKALATPAATA